MPSVYNLQSVLVVSDVKESDLGSLFDRTAGHCIRLVPRDAKERGVGRVGTVRLRCDIAFRSTVDEVHTRFCYTVFDLRHCT